MPEINVNDITYNPTVGAFQARVDIRTQNGSFRYPCEVPGPLNMDPEAVRQQLRNHALRMSDSGAALFSRI